jgi:hypothetical protein
VIVVFTHKKLINVNISNNYYLNSVLDLIAI